MQLEIIKKVSLLNKNTILFVHGAYHAAWCWEEHFIPFFYAHGYNVYAMSFRNHGNSERIENVDQIVVKDMVEDLIKTIDMIDGKIILIAHSFASAPLLQRNIFFIPAASDNLSANSA